MYLWLIVIFAVVVADQVTKLFVVELLDRTASLDIIPGILRFTYTENTGMAFGMLGEKNQRWVFMVVSVIALVGLLIYMWKAKLQSRWANMALSLIIGGGIGNMIDRVFNGSKIFDGAVVDFIEAAFIDFPVFNVADSAVCIGAALLIIYLISDMIRESRAKKQKISDGEENAE